LVSKQEAYWVLRAQAGDREVLELLLRSIQPVLSRYVRGLVGEFHADDVTQDVLLIVYRKLFRMTHKILQAIELGTRRAESE
jgi:DNA-directed RNA polymerase specialized sigma24 family protein